jgi:hypothetical protein
MQVRHKFHNLEQLAWAPGTCTIQYNISPRGIAVAHFPVTKLLCEMCEVVNTHTRIFTSGLVWLVPGLRSVAFVFYPLAIDSFNLCQKNKNKNV